MRLIDADALIAKAYIMQEPNGFIHSVVTERQIVKAPTIEAEPVKHGRWVLGTTNHHEWMKCSECLHSYDLTGVFVYCPNCGATMLYGGAES